MLSDYTSLMSPESRRVAALACLRRYAAGHLDDPYGLDVADLRAALDIGDSHATGLATDDELATAHANAMKVAVSRYNAYKKSSADETYCRANAAFAAGIILNPEITPTTDGEGIGPEGGIPTLFLVLEREGSAKYGTAARADAERWIEEKFKELALLG